MSKQRIVLILPIPYWHPGTSELISRLRNRNFEVHSLDIINCKHIDNNDVLHDYVPKYLIGIFKKVFRRLYRRFLISKIIRNNDILDMQYVDCFYHNYLKDFRRKQITLISTFFGSDLYRTTHPKQKDWQKIILDNSDAIVMGENMITAFNDDFPGLSQKVSFNQYGSSRLDLIDEVYSEESRKIFRKKYNIPEKSVVITIGYNSKVQQQHIKVINAIKNIPETLKEKVFLLLPLTYGGNSSYINEVKQVIFDSKLPCKYFESFLSNEELVETKIISDITINTQTTDALASSIKEAFAANDVVIVGDWLPYEIYENIGIKFIRTSFDNLSDNISNAIQNLDELKSQNGNNRENVLKFASWKSLIIKWENFYKQFKHEEIL